MFGLSDVKEVIKAGYSSIEVLIEKVREFKDATDYIKTTSIADVSKLTKVEPLTIISHDLIFNDNMPDINNTILSLFSAYYLQAVSLVGAIDNVNVVRTLDKLNPDRDNERLLYPSVENYNGTIKEFFNKTDEIFNIDNYKYKLPNINNGKSIALLSENGVDGNVKDNISILNQASSLSVGKLLSLSFKSETDDGKGRTDTLPVSVRLACNIMNNKSITALLSGDGVDKDIIERFHSWRSGRISFIKDLLFCQDLIDAHKKNLIRDKSGVKEEILKRVRNSKRYGILTKNPSLSSASNIFIISDKVAKEVEYNVRGKLSKYSSRVKVFDENYMMILAVVNTEWERVTFYTRGVKAETDYSFKEIKNISKKQDTSIVDLLKSIQLGSPVSF